MAALNMLMHVTTIARLMTGDLLRRKLPTYLVIVFILALTTAFLLTAFMIGGFLTLFMVLTDNGLIRGVAAAISLLIAALGIIICGWLTHRSVSRLAGSTHSYAVPNIQNIADAFLNGLNRTPKR